VLVDAAGAPVMAGRHPLGDLAPRDVVAAAMHERMSRGDGPADHLWLDATGLGRAALERDFPTVTAACRAAGLDPAAEPIPVAPGAHYACGGIAATLDGTTTVPGLYAIGEAAATGVHGANRLASNSLTEALLAGRRTGDHLGRALPPPPAGPLTAPPPGPGAAPAGRTALAAAMSRSLGVLRDRVELTELLDELADFAFAPAGSPAAARLDPAVAEATSLHTVATLVIVAALARAESRGCHRWRGQATADGPATSTRLRVRDGAVTATRPVPLTDPGLVPGHFSAEQVVTGGTPRPHESGLASGNGASRTGHADPVPEKRRAEGTQPVDGAEPERAERADLAGATRRGRS
jgi:L-aspartate oxidase